MGAVDEKMSLKSALCLLFIFALFHGLEAQAFAGNGRGGRGRNRRGRHNDNPIKHLLYPRWNRYDRSLKPPTENADQQLDITVNMFVRELGPLNIDDNSFRMQVTFRQEYMDSRLSWDSNNPEEHLTLTGEEADSVWMPDTFVRNERSIVFHNAMVPNKYARIYPDGRVLTSQKVTLQLSCPGLKRAFTRGNGPHECGIDIASYGWKAEELNYRWKPTNAVQSSSDTTKFLNDGFKLDAHRTERCDVETSTGKYSCIRLVATFSKKKKRKPPLFLTKKKKKKKKKK